MSAEWLKIRLSEKKSSKAETTIIIYFQSFVISVLSILLHFFFLGFASLDVIHHGIWDNVSDGYEWREFISVMTKFSIIVQSANYEREERNQYNVSNVVRFSV